MSPAIAAILSLAATLPGQLVFTPQVVVKVDPPVGTPEDVFTITITNGGTDPFVYDDCCAAPTIVGSADRAQAFCPPCPARPCKQAGGSLGPGESLRYEWDPTQYACDRTAPPPGLYDVSWQGFPESVKGRLELLPDPDTELTLTADPKEARPGEPIHLTVTNPLGEAVSYNVCCNPPLVIDPAGFQAYCPICPQCILVKELAPGESLDFTWTPGEGLCGEQTAVLPGPYRIVWKGSRGMDADGKTIESAGEVTVLVHPISDHAIDLAVSSTDAHPGDVLHLTATNTLDVPLQHLAFPGPCFEVVLLDALGKSAFCIDCPVLAGTGGGAPETIPPGGTTTIDVEVPQQVCAQAFGDWTVLWGRSFRRDDEQNGPPVLGLAMVHVTAAGGAGTFIRGDCDRSGVLDLTDAVSLLDRLFLGGAAPTCPDACDADDSGSLDITDAVALLGYLFLGAAAPPAPFPGAGQDPTADALGCGG